MNYIKPAAMIPVDTAVSESSFELMLRQDALARLVHMRAAFHRKGRSNLSDKGLNLSGCVAARPLCHHNTRRVFKSSAKDSTALRCAAVAASGTFNQRDDQLCESAVPRTSSVPYWWVNNPTLGEFCFTMIGRADIEGSKSSVAMSGSCHKPVIPVMCAPAKLPRQCPRRIDRPASLGSKEGLLPASDSAIGLESSSTGSSFPLILPSRSLGCGFAG
ncbi:hypothetical protein Bca52824_096267 [Brassica carinata]|uniref:Uncharacterized protein n=1 Tax=Brassica carinata TaxID=52824 RepID=A0A8X7TH54_BRACI|nr:hypothetical protein Bca52824_096267 [Brassica carinata]